jgi:hypothetical protein
VGRRSAALPVRQAPPIVAGLPGGAKPGVSWETSMQAARRFWQASGVLLAILAGCSDTGEELDAYLFGPGGMEMLLAEEARVIEEFNEQINRDANSEERAQAVAELLREQVLPGYAQVLGRMKRLRVENKRVSKLHEAYLDIAERQKQAFEELLGLLEAEDFKALARVNLHLAQLRNRRSDWEQELRRLCEKHEVTRSPR